MQKISHLTRVYFVNGYFLNGFLTLSQRRVSMLKVAMIGHHASGKSTTAGHMIYKRGWISKMTVDKKIQEIRDFRKLDQVSPYSWIFDK